MSAGISSALAAAVLFGLSAPVSKLLLPATGPLLLAALLYLGAGLGLAAATLVAAREAPHAAPREARLRGVDFLLLFFIIAIVAYALGIYGSIYPGSAPSAPFNFMGPLTASWIAIGIGVVLYLRTKSPELVGKLGQALGEEGGSEAEAGLA